MSASYYDPRMEMMYNYKLYSIKRFPLFLKYSWPTAKAIVNEEFPETASSFVGWLKSVSILLDMIWSNLRYGAMHNRDYLLFQFWKKSGIERNKFFTRRRYFRLIKKFDKDTFCHSGGKTWIYQKYSGFIKRDWILTDSKTSEHQVIDFFDKHNKVLVKPVSSEQGSGIYIVYNNDLQKIKSLIEECKTTPLLLEEVCENCDELNLINSNSLNTLRVYTIVNKQGDVIIPSVSLRCGRGDTVVDNWGAGGVGYPVDIETGIISAPGTDKSGKKYIYHPGTNVIMPGFKIPRFKEACDMVKDIINLDKNVVYAGHDIAILSDRVELIEVNFPGGHDFLQALDQIGKYEIMQTVKTER